MAERTFHIVGLTIAAILVLLMVNRAVVNPMDAERRVLDGELARVVPETLSSDWDGDADFDAVQSAIISKDSLWNELVPPQTAQTQPPDLDKMLKGVVVSTRGIGSRVHIIAPGNPEGDLYGVGDVVNGLTITSVTRTEVVFSLVQDGKEYTKTLARE